MKNSTIDEIRRISSGYRPMSKTWYYQILYDVCTLICVIRMCVENEITKRIGSLKNNKQKVKGEMKI